MVPQNIKPLLFNKCLQLIQEHLSKDCNEADLTVQFTKKEFQGDYTIVLFGLSKKIQKKPSDIGNEIGTLFLKHYPETVAKFEVVAGFLNLSLTDDFFYHSIKNIDTTTSPNALIGKKEKVVIEYSSPNTNKPLHLGHLRNIFLGSSIVELMKFYGHEVKATCVVNDRGIHICKSMLAWKKFGANQTPQTAKIKPDHFVGNYYVKFSQALEEEIKQLQAEKGYSKEEAEKKSVLMQEVQSMLMDWEKKDEEVLQLWTTMNQWVYDGFEATYKKIGVHFDKVYFESQTYLLGKALVNEGLSQNVFFKKEDGSVWIDLTKDGHDQKLLLRKDGTSVYMTQDLGLAQEKFKDFQYAKSIYVVGDEQNYHFQVLKLVLQHLHKSYADGIYHLSYGMVELPSGKMKSREGTVVDADDILDEVQQHVLQQTQAMGKTEKMSDEELKKHSQILGYGALRFFMLRTDAKKRILYDPSEMIDLNGFTSVFINYTYSRILSLLTKANYSSENFSPIPFEECEKEILKQLDHFPNMIEETIQQLNPSLIAIYAFHLAKAYNTFYNQCPILHAEENLKNMRLLLSKSVMQILKQSMQLLQIQLVNKM